MIPLFGLLTIIVLSIIVVRFGAIALELTGLSPEIASFQAQSAFSGAGFTTSESETIVTHPLRRRIIRILILFGSAGITTSMATLVLTFMGQTGENAMHRGLTLVVGVVIIFLFARSKIIYNLMKKIISKALERWTTMRIFDYEQLLGFNEGYTISRISVRDDSWLSGKKLSELRLEQEGVLILAIYRKIDGKEKFVGGPTGETVIKAQDVLICYSRQDASKALAQKGKQEN
ncbi:MAG: TrkA C-terminal domain-containing protein [Candidatus Omnitrophica bacterium]|nr:TrkA C-terminal domain-containing protein [Candidatus Omnitrophota bacterium]MBU4473380.1 TrkA C-terminal domain-containing protein [Candidatus Omnitrophota bacterium]MCG2706979.1 TrkA C-terminal domain-containing protein [Candidatus Omnitrophota bacterium]